MRRIVILFAFIFFLKTGNAQEFKVSANGMVSFSVAELVVGEAGNDINATLSSNTIYLSIGSDYFWDMKNERWSIYVNKSDIDWDDDIELNIKRTGSGAYTQRKGNPYVKNGKNFQKITNNPSYFFNGKDKISNIPLEFQLKNMSLTMGAHDFETDVIFTIYDD